MSHPLHAAFYADRAAFYRVEVAENVRVAHDTWRVRFVCPEMARRIVPGQFLMMRLAGYEDPLLGRPLALYDTVLDAAGQPVGLDVVYLVLGKLTSRLAEFRVGQKLEVWGPLGNGFPAESVEHLIMVGGGIGQTPFLALAHEYLGHRRYGDPPRAPARAGHVTLCYGVRRAEYLAGVDDFRRIGVEVHVSTDDGSAGHHGLVTELVRRVLGQGSGAGGRGSGAEGLSPRRVAGGKQSGARDKGQGDGAAAQRVVCCGPWPMMRAVAEIALAAAVTCHASLETPMACGLGICFSCVAKVRDADGNWDYRRTCVEGPVFDAERIEW